MPGSTLVHAEPDEVPERHACRPDSEKPVMIIATGRGGACQGAGRRQDQELLDEILTVAE